MAIYYIPVAQTDGTVQITEQIRALTDVSAHELSYAAKKNVLRQMIIRPMAEIMADMMGTDYIPELDDDSDSIIVISSVFYKRSFCVHFPPAKYLCSGHCFLFPRMKG